MENDAENPDRPRQSVYEPTRSMSVISSGRSSSICSAFRGSICNVEYGIELNEEFIDSSSAELTEAHGTGEARRCIIIKYFRAGANWPFLCLLLLMFALTQFLASAADIWLSIWFVVVVFFRFAFCCYCGSKMFDFLSFPGQRTRSNGH